ncbi:T/G mismatch-specific endonuclease [Alkalibacterium putridalgicola]|uniref:Very short patch repair endonuclease n=1 Tax=Alkalibacterium putridalgicola TaxID=426703 RepID=A0A1H7TVC7_9LACT|nr:DNA mismatch endonuclease Vsr [Alkalibacterium putridalgicola]GEK88594.1 very short patch repair endonuclease [Alkalibacterium putridalgicola]SEL88802.1 T/G mismatch-specific endonuclease [Alkalibacterium putridalgicola]
MADKISKEARSRNMSLIQSKDTKPEMLVRKYLFNRGLRYRLHDKRLPGKPDLIFPKYKTAVFVNGCFWHRHGCRYTTTPKTNTDFWLDKFQKNVNRDIQNYEELDEAGWNVIVVWECDLKKDRREETLAELYDKITDSIK